MVKHFAYALKDVILSNKDVRISAHAFSVCNPGRRVPHLAKAFIVFGSGALFYIARDRGQALRNRFILLAPPPALSSTCGYPPGGWVSTGYARNTCHLGTALGPVFLAFRFCNPEIATEQVQRFFALNTPLGVIAASIVRRAKRESCICLCAMLVATVAKAILVAYTLCNTCET